MGIKTRRKLRCNPNISLNKKYQCYPDYLNYNLKEIWNKKHGGSKTKKIYSDDTVNIKNKLYDEKSNCDNDICILKEILSTKDFNNMLSYYAPIANWDKDPQQWLNTTDINNVLKQYDDKYKSFKFLGVCPIDWDYRIKNGDDYDCVCKKICDLNIQNEESNGYDKIGAVFNLDEHDKPGSHWVALFIDIPGKKMSYFDSEGGRCPTRIKKIYHNLKKKSSNKDFKFDSNYGIIHQKKNSECGIYCIFFILQMIENNNFNYFKDRNRIISDEEMNTLRYVHFNLL